MNSHPGHHTGARVVSWSRRGFVKAAAGAASAVALVAAGADLLIRRRVVARPAQRAAAELSAAELAAVAAVALVLFPATSEQESALVERTARWWAAGRSAHGGRLPVYRGGLAALAAVRREAGHTDEFAELSPAVRSGLVASMMAGASDAPFRPFAAELLEGLYSDAPGWTLVGYRTWPGIASPPGEYSRRPRRA